MNGEAIYVFHLARMYNARFTVPLFHYVRVLAGSASEAVDKLLDHLVEGGYIDWYFDFELIDYEECPKGEESMLLGTVTNAPVTGEPIVDLGDEIEFTIDHSRKGWIIFTPMNTITRETCQMLVELGYIRPMGYGYVSTKQEVLLPGTPEIEKTRSPRASR